MRKKKVAEKKIVATNWAVRIREAEKMNQPTTLMVVNKVKFVYGILCILWAIEEARTVVK